MQCLSPISIKNPRKGSIVSPRIKVPCGKCFACLSNNRNMWTFRLTQESDNSKSNYFITLTYADNKKDVSKRDIQLFFKRFREYIRPLGLNFKYYLTSEYGGKTHRPHYHFLLFFKEIVDVDYVYDAIIETWKLGHIYIGGVTTASIHYVTKYHISRLESPEDREKNFCLMSRKPAIGSDYIVKKLSFHKGNTDRNFVVHKGGMKGSLPRYYKQKMYTDEEIHIIGLKGKRLLKELLDEKEFFKKHPDMKYSDYCKRLVEIKENIQRKQMKSKQNDKL